LALREARSTVKVDSDCVVDVSRFNQQQKPIIKGFKAQNSGGNMQYHAPSSFDDAIAIANNAQGITRFMAGGTDVLVQLRADIVTPDVLIDIKKIAGVSDIAREGGGWRIGVAVTGAEMSEHGVLGKEWPGVVEAMDLVGSTQIQGRATLTGNLCNGSPAADSVPAMIAARARVTVVGPNGTRQVAVEDIPTGPGRTSLAKGEMIAAVHLPARQPNAGDAYLRFIPRTEMDIAVVGCAVNLRLEGKTIVEARVALGAVAPTVLLVEAAAKAIIGTTLDAAALEALAAAASAACRPINDKRGTIVFRTHVAGVLAKRAAKIAYDRAEAAS
jgi:xanthine dehydrogenase FAD-binding subunit